MRGDAGVASDQGDRLDARLRNKKAVEGVAVRLAVPLDVGKAAIRGGVGSRDRQQREALGEQLLRPPLGSLELAEGRLDRYLEQRAGAEQRLL
jgi:hypothetical protein